MTVSSVKEYHLSLTTFSGWLSFGDLSLLPAGRHDPPGTQGGLQNYPTLRDKEANIVLPSARRTKRSIGLSPLALATSSFTPLTELTGIWLIAIL